MSRRKKFTPIYKHPVVASHPETLEPILKGLELSGEALKPVYAAIMERFSDGRLYVRDWKSYDPEMPEWEKKFERLYGEIYATVLAAAGYYDLNPRAWLEAYIEACQANDYKPLANVEEFFPWNMCPTFVFDDEGSVAYGVSRYRKSDIEERKCARKL